MADYRCMVGNVQFEHGTFCSTRKQESNDRIIRSCQKYPRSSANRLPLAKDGTGGASVSLITVTNKSNQIHLNL